MASVYYLLDDAKDIADYIIWSTQDKAEVDKKRYFAALVIQRTFRGFAARCFYRGMVKAAIVIQKYVRGYLLRLHMGEIAGEAFKRKCMGTFHKLATKIQAVWRGYWVRKNINIATIVAERKMELETQQAIGRFFSKIFKERESSQSESSLEMGEEEEDNEKLIRRINKRSPDILQALFDKHHLLRTHQIEGVLSVHGSKQLSLLETFLKKLECKEYMNEVKTLYEEENIPEVEYMFKDEKARRIEDLLRQKKHREGEEKEESITKSTLKSIHRKPFLVTKKIEEKKYQKSMMGSEKYTGYTSPVFREQGKDDFEQRFNLDVHHIDSNAKQETPYFIDYWKKTCCNHNFMYDFMEDIHG